MSDNIIVVFRCSINGSKFSLVFIISYHEWVWQREIGENTTKIKFP